MLLMGMAVAMGTVLVAEGWCLRLKRHERPGNHRVVEAERALCVAEDRHQLLHRLVPRRLPVEKESCCHGASDEVLAALRAFFLFLFCLLLWSCFWSCCCWGICWSLWRVLARWGCLNGPPAEPHGLVQVEPVLQRHHAHGAQLVVCDGLEHRQCALVRSEHRRGLLGHAVLAQPRPQGLVHRRRRCGHNRLAAPVHAHTRRCDSQRRLQDARGPDGAAGRARLAVDHAGAVRAQVGAAGLVLVLAQARRKRAQAARLPLEHRLLLGVDLHFHLRLLSYRFVFMLCFCMFWCLCLCLFWCRCWRLCWGLCWF